MLNILYGFLTFVITISILITVHEFGHFLAARCYGVRIERFSIGFGKTLWGFTDRFNTEYVIGCIPLGGYVKMLDKSINKTKNSLTPLYESFNNKTIIQRFVIIIAGPLANFIFSICIYCFLFMHGIPTVRPIISEIVSGSIAEKSQITSGMEIKAIDGNKTPDWDSVRMLLLSKIGNNKVIFTLSKFGENYVQQKNINLHNLKLDLDKQDLISALGIIELGTQIDTTLANVLKNTPASEAGLQAGDKLIKVNGLQLIRWQNFLEEVRDNIGKKIVIEVERNGTLFDVTLLIRKHPINKTVGFIGVIPQVLPLSEDHKIIRKYGFFDSIIQASIKTFQVIKVISSLLGKLFTNNFKIQNLKGPISIAYGAKLSAQCGLIYYMIFLAIISINLGVINLVPIPILDGGHLIFLVIEKIKGTQLSEHVQNISNHIGLIILMILTGLALFNDFSHL